MEGVTLRSADGIDQPDVLAAMIGDYLTPIVAELGKNFEDAPGVDAFVARTMDRLEDYLPPHGRSILVEDDDGTLVGCGFLKRIRPDAAEMKRLYVRPSMRGTGLGKRIIDRLIKEAQEMGCTWMYLDTGKHMTDIQAMYLRLGFERIEPYPESENGPEMVPYLTFMRRRIA